MELLLDASKLTCSNCLDAAEIFVTDAELSSVLAVEIAPDRREINAAVPEDGRMVK